jgi:2-dehydro-3-deoxyphosphogluconate aldolase/(4S)-4-hydroxy-2-oxoglutarate aldolase
VLVVLRPADPLEAVPSLERFLAMGLLHVEIAWREQPGWSEACAELVQRFDALRLGAASVCSEGAVTAAARAGFGYAVSPVLEPNLLRQAARLDLTLIPGVMTPSEIHTARRLGCRLVKLFPAATLGISYWARLREPLGDDLPFCIAAGGLAPEQVKPWLEAGVDAVTLGSQLADAGVLVHLLRDLAP